MEKNYRNSETSEYVKRINPLLCALFLWRLTLSAMALRFLIDNQGLLVRLIIFNVRHEHELSKQRGYEPCISLQWKLKFYPLTKSLKAFCVRRLPREKDTYEVECHCRSVVVASLFSSDQREVGQEDKKDGCFIILLHIIKSELVHQHCVKEAQLLNSLLNETNIGKLRRQPIHSPYSTKAANPRPLKKTWQLSPVSQIKFHISIQTLTVKSCKTNKLRSTKTAAGIIPRSWSFLRLV
ncbi:hypothetical protein Cgig2_017006 [Carnegiea gigantea]|uniref:Uncharacterized protein n=1 Tax=Carnegiea gigantea TaxID=171969 RepID=A0A9Q1KIN6_9CARY|nr:hypothetical protein Cgig2_017006 [Carnegiea gigantea]